MAKNMFLHRAIFQIQGMLNRKARQGTVLLLGFALIAVSPQVVFGQSSQQEQQQQEQQRQQEEQQRQQQEQQRQQEEQQRQQQEQEQQQRDQQQRDEQQRQQQEQQRQQEEQQRQQQEQQQRDQQQRDEQQRQQQEQQRQQEEQQRQQQEQQRQQQEQQRQQQEQQQRDQQAREQQQQQQQQRDEQQRQQQDQQRQQQEQQQRDQQAREQQQREQQARDQEQRNQQQRAQQLQQHVSGEPVAVSNPNSPDSQPAVKPPAADIKRALPEPPTAGTEHKINPLTTVVTPTAVKEREPSPLEPDLRQRVLCGNEPCKQVAPPPIKSDLRHRVCTNGVCQPCPTGQSAGKDGSCSAPPPQSGVTPVDTQQCVAGQSWDGHQCVMVAPPVGIAQTDCAGPTASAQNVIVRLRSARLRKNDACGNNSTGKDCDETTAQYNSTFNEYQAFLGGVPAECRAGLLDPTAI